MSLERSRLSNVQLVPLTPFSDDGTRVRPEILSAFASDLYREGVRVFIPGAGTGEFHSLSADEVVSCVKAVREGAGAEATVIAPIGLGLTHALTIGRRAIEAGADALLVMPLVHPYLGDSGVRDYFRVLMEALPLPFLAYKKGPYPSDHLLGELAGTGQLIGVKYAVNDVNAVARFIQEFGQRVGVYCGTAERFAPFFHLAGASGYTSGAGNVCPRLTLALHRALKEGDQARAWELMEVIRPIEDYRARLGDSYNISLLKVAIRLTGRDFGPVRPPQPRLDKADEHAIQAMLEPILAIEASMPSIH